MIRPDVMHDDDPVYVDPFDDDDEQVASCNLENPELCEACD